MKTPIEFKVMKIKECVASDCLIDTPEKASEYWKANIPSSTWFDPAKEIFIVLVLNTRHKIIGHNLVAIGCLDSVYIHPREVFRPIIVAAGAATILMHSHPSGNSMPSEADIKVTRDLIKAGQLLKIEILDHVIVGDHYTSLRELGYFYT